MKPRNHFGTRLFAILLLVVVIAQAAARGYEFIPDEDDFFSPPPPDTPGTDSARKLRFPITDAAGSPFDDPDYRPMDLGDPANARRSYEYDADSNRYYYDYRIGDDYIRNGGYMSFDEYSKYRAKQDEQEYWRRRLDALTMFSKKPELPELYKEGLFDRIFGSNTISVRPQGNIDVTLGGNWQNIQNPTLVRRAQKYGIFDFDMQMNINLLAQIGDKLKLNISNNTKATFDYQNVQKLEYTGKEDEIIKKIEAGNTDFPLNTSLVSGVRSLFGLKTQLQFGKLWVTSVLSQQKSQRRSLQVQGGSQTQQFGIKADDYEENKHFLLSQYFVGNYNYALKDFPVIRSLVNINKIEIWVTNRTGATEGVRDILGFQDLGEKVPYAVRFQNPAGENLPTNRANTLYDQLVQNPQGRQQSAATQSAISLGLVQSTDFERTTARKLNPSEYYYNSQLGYISLNTQINPDDILCAAYRYTYNGKVFQVGEFAEDLPPDTTNQKVLYLKLLKGQSLKPSLPVWKLMMKNVYALGGLGVSKEDFRLNIHYQDPGGGEKRYLPESNIPNPGTPLLTLLNLDRLNFQNDPQSDGVFDYIEGITINPQQGKIIFPVLEPFGKDLKPALGGNVVAERRYLYQVLYDSTKTVARQQQQNNRYVIRGSYRSASSSEIFLGGFNIPPGSVVVNAGGQKLTENLDYQIDYGLGRLRIINPGVLSSGIPINIQYEDNATFGFQQQNFIGTRFDYFSNPHLTLGGTFMRLTERPFTQKTSFGEDPIKNTVLGLDVNYQNEAPGITRILDKLPIYSTTAPSFLTASAEVAGLFPSHPKQINSLDPEGAVYVDDFEGTRSSYDLKFPAMSWTLATTPVGARGAAGNLLFPEATDNNRLSYNKNRARFAWYFIEPTLVDPAGGIPGYVKADSLNQHYIRLVQQQDVFPQKTNVTLQNALSTLDLTYFPKDRGPYNVDPTGLDADGRLTNPSTRWGGIQRSIEQSDFEASNVEFIEFWVMDPFIKRPLLNSGQLYLNLGNVSEDVLKDSRKSFENGIVAQNKATSLDQSVWGYVPRFQQQVTRAFDNDPATRTAQDVGYDGLDNEEEKIFYRDYLAGIATRFGTTSPIYLAALADPAGDDYHYFRGFELDSMNAGVLRRYKEFNNSQGNSPVPSSSATFSNAATTIPESEDINRDNTLNESEDYYQYRVDLKPNMQVGDNFVVNKQVSAVKLPNGQVEDETWYQFKIPIREYQQKVGNIADFRNIRFMRLFMNGFEDSVTMRFAQLNLGRNLWRRYFYSLKNPGENIPANEQLQTPFTVTSVSLEENSKRDPVPYVIPPGVNRQNAAQGNGQNIQLNEQALSLQVCNLIDGDARAVFKEVNVDMRQFGSLRMFIHAESVSDQAPLRDGDVRAFIRIGSDFINNYYEYQIPLKMSPARVSDETSVWPDRNLLDLRLSELVRVKTERNTLGLPAFVPYSASDDKGNTIVVVGNPNVGEAKTILLGVLNPKAGAASPGDDGLSKCTEIWFNELRMTGLNEKPGYAALGKIDVQLADLGNVHLGGAMHTQGYGNIDQKLQQRMRDNYTQYEATTNINAGKLMPKSWGVQLPVYYGKSQTLSNPQYNPYDLDVVYKDQLKQTSDRVKRDSLKKVAQDLTSITSFNISNVRVLGSGTAKGKPLPWSVKNFDLSYAYNQQYKRNPLIESDKLETQRLGLGYTYAISSKSIEPFKALMKKRRSKWYSFIKDFNFNPLPSNFTFRTDLNRILNETQVRNVSDGPYKIAPTYYKNFLWTRSYTLRWELTRSLSFNYDATNISRIDEPNGRIDNKEKRDTVWDRLKSFGRNTLFTQSLNATYNVPLSKLPITDWMTARVSYTSSFTYAAASQLARSLGNTIGNTQTKQLTGDLNFTQLYNKNRWLRAVQQPKAQNLRGKQTGKKPDSRTSGSKTPRGERDRAELDPRNPPRPGQDRDPAAGSEPAPEGGTSREPQPVVKDPKAPAEPAPRTDIITLNGVNIVTSSMSDKQVDSLRRIVRANEVSKSKAEKKKRQAARKLARQQRRNTTPAVSDGVRAAGRILTMVKRATVSYNEQSGTVLPGYLDSTVAFGVNTNNLAPGPGFAFGYQPGRDYLENQASDRRLSTDTLFNAQFQQQYGQTMNFTAQIEPIPNDLRIDLSLTKSFTRAHSELFKDTGSARGFEHLNPFESGSFSISYIALNTMFESSGVNGPAYRNFLAARPIISNRLGNNNPYTRGAKDPINPEYAKGYGQYSQEVLVPAFIAAYSGKSATDAPLVAQDNGQTRNNPFRYYLPLPNWKLTYNGLSRLPLFKDVVSNFVLNHAYSGKLEMNSFANSLLYYDQLALGYPSFIDSNSGNLVPFFQVPNITITEQFGPFLGADASFKSGLTASLKFYKSRTVSLSLVDFQVSETRSQEWTVGAGYRVRGLKLPFEVFGIKKLENDLNMKLDIGVRDDRTSNSYLAQNLDVITRGQKVITISPSIDYIASERLTIRLFYDRRQSIPYISTSYPITTTRAGITLRFIFAQ